MLIRKVYLYGNLENEFILQNKLTNWDGIRDQVKIYFIIYL